MDRPRLSVLCTVHSEALVSGPTMRAAAAAISFAEARGVSVECLLGLDDPTEATRTFFSQSIFDRWRRIELSYGDPGKTRNALVAESAGELIAFLDGDDLYSENWLYEGSRIVAEAEADGRRVIVHPELNWFFDGSHTVTKVLDQRDPLFSPRRCYTGNYYDTLCIAPRRAHEDFPYADRDIPNGFAVEDFQFGIETMADGWVHVVARDTIIFKRKRDGSLISQARARRAIMRQLDCMAIDRIADLGTPHE